MLFSYWMLQAWRAIKFPVAQQLIRLEYSAFKKQKWNEMMKKYNHFYQRNDMDMSQSWIPRKTADITSEKLLH